MFCAISGVTPEDPVVSVKSGYVYEKRLILQHLLSTGGKDPETGEDMSEADLVAVKTSGSAVKPQPTTATSIPGTLVHLRNEWDAVMLETFKLKQSLKTTRQELSQSLYYYDAALRVIARLTTERDEARQALSELKESGVVSAPVEKAVNGEAKVKNDEKMEVDAEDKEEGPTLLSSEILDEINAKADALQKWRKKRPPIDGLRKPADIGAFDEKHSGGVEGKAVQVMRTELSDEVEEENQRVVIGCDDGYCRILSSDGKIEKQFKAHKKAVTGLAMSTSMDVILSGGADSDAIVWRENSGKYQKKATLKAHSKSVSACSMHPTQKLFATASLDSTWAMHDLETDKTLTQVSDPDESPYQCAEFHPDGAIFVSGAEKGLVRIWDVRTLTHAATFETTSGSVSSVVLSENGFFLASVAGNEHVQLWDLRKLKATKNLDLPGEFGVESACFDMSGSYLALGGAKGVKVLDVKKWKELVSLDQDGVTCLGWQRSAAWLSCGSRSGVVNFYGK